MRTTTTNRWVWVFAGALPAVGLGAGCGDDSAVTGATSGGGGFGGFGGGDATQASSSAGSPTSSSSGGTPTSSSSGNPTSTASSSSGGEGGTGGDPGEGGGGGTGGAEPFCGDGLIDAGQEDCDGANLGDLDCESQGYAGGTISCADDCTLDVTACLTCGNGIADGNDDCDGDDLAGNTCEDLDFDGGELGCTGRCEYDTTGCTLDSCGDGSLNGEEDCEGADLGGATCVSLGFVSGTLGCNAAGAAGECQFNIDQCETCGNGEVDPGDECDGADLGGQTCLTQGFTGGVLACGGACTFDETGCTNFALPTAGQLVINEIMPNPAALGDADGEYFEVLNTTASALQLRGCQVTGTGMADDQFAIDADVVVPANGIVTFARTASPGFTGADFVWPDISGSRFQLANGDDGIIITCDGVEVDRVEYEIGANGWPAAGPLNGRSLSLDPASATSGLNNNGANWCAASTNSANFVSTDRGTPDNANPSCAGSTVAITDCHLQFPEVIDENAGTQVQIFGRVFSAGVTDQNLTGNDASPIIASVGFGPVGALPATFAWSAATANAGYNTSSPDFEATFDEYSGTFSVPAPGSYDFAVRFSGDGGGTWTYCDLDGGAYDSPMAGDMTSTPSGVDYSGLFFSEYIEGTSNNKALEIYNSSGAAIDLAGCTVSAYFNADDQPGPAFNLTGTLAAGDVFVLCNGSEADFTDALCDARLTGGGNATTFNGNDAVELACSGTPLDYIGQIASNTNYAVDVILRRSCDVTAGDPIGNDAFIAANEWTTVVYSAGAANADLGQQVCE